MMKRNLWQRGAMGYSLSRRCTHARDWDQPVRRLAPDGRGGALPIIGGRSLRSRALGGDGKPSLVASSICRAVWLLETPSSPGRLGDVGAPDCGPRARSHLLMKVCAEGEKTTLAISHYKLARFPRHVGEMPGELHVAGCVLRIKRVRIFDGYIGVEQFVGIFIGIGYGRLGTAEMNRVLVARNNGVDWRILPRAHAFEAELVFVIGKSGGNVRGEELGRDLADHQSNSSADTRSRPD